MSRVRVKICGVTTVEDGRCVAGLGPDMIGLNLYAGPRFIDTERAAAVLEVLPPIVTPVVLLCADANGIESDRIAWLGRHRITYVQAYGNVTPEVVRQLGERGIGVVYVTGAMDGGFTDPVRGFLAACGGMRPVAVLLDASTVERAGGTGRRANWRAIGAARQSGQLDDWPPIWLAGGLDATNVAEAIRFVQPDVVDVSSGVEVSPGRKDATRVESFIRAAEVACH